MGKKKLTNRFWFQLHGWFSLPVWVLFCFICITGTLAVLSHELTWLTNEHARAVNPDNLPQRSVDELVARFEAHYPSAHVTSVISREPYLVKVINFTDTDKPIAQAYVNQYTGEIQQIVTDMTFIDFMRALHGWLLFPWQQGYSIGYYLVSLMSILVLGALVTGLMVYKKFWQSFTRPKLRTGQGSRTTLSDLHKLGGVWSIWFLAVMGITGVWYLTQAILWHTETEFEPHPEPIAIADVPLNNTESVRHYVDLKQALAVAKLTYPEFEPSFIAMPEHHRDTYKLAGSGGELFYDQYSYMVAVNPWNADVEDSFSPQSMGTLQTFMHIADPLHFGTLGGIWTKIIWFIFGLILSGMSITGFYMWYLRVIKKPTRNKAISTTETTLQETLS